MSVMQEDLHLLLSKLPRLIQTSGDEKKLQNFSLVRGYLNILGPNICSVLNSASHLKRLSLALVQVKLYHVEQSVLDQPTCAPDNISWNSIKCFFQINKSIVQILLFAKKLLLYLSQDKNSISGSSPRHKTKLHFINTYLTSGLLFNYSLNTFRT